MFVIDNHASFHLWWKENFLKHQKFSKSNDNDCSYLRCKVASKCLNVYERVEVVEKNNKDGSFLPHMSFSVNASVSERNPDTKNK